VILTASRPATLRRDLQRILPMRPLILVVEDRETTRRGVVEGLRRGGYDARGARNGRIALAYLKRGGRADVIVLDLIMPELDGWTFRRAQLADPWLADIPLIAMSVLNDRSVSGIRPDAVVVKPIDLSLLLQTVEDLCARNKAITLD
jgi:CheY-like chemotaxis protein